MHEVFRYLRQFSSSMFGSMTLLMTFDHMFIMRKLGYHALTRDEEDRVIETIMETAASHGLRIDSEL